MVQCYTVFIFDNVTKIVSGKWLMSLIVLWLMKQPFWESRIMHMQETGNPYLPVSCKGSLLSIA